MISDILIKNIVPIGFWLFLVFLTIKVFRRDLTKAGGSPEWKLSRNRKIAAGFGLGILAFFVSLWLLPRPDIYSSNAGVLTLVVAPIQIGLIPLILGLVIGLIAFLSIRRVSNNKVLMLRLTLLLVLLISLLIVLRIK